MDNYEQSIKDLKELILTKFDELEKQQQLRDENNRLRFEAIESKNNEQDVKIAAMEKSKNGTWDKIINAAINWAVPFICVAALFYIQYGAKGK